MSGLSQHIEQGIEWCAAHEGTVILICGGFIALLTLSLIAIENYRDSKNKE